MKEIEDIREKETSELLGYVEVCRQRCCATKREDRREYHRNMKHILDELQRRGEITPIEKWKKYLYCKANCMVVMHLPAFNKCECNSSKRDVEDIASSKKASIRRIKLEKQEINALAEILEFAKKCPVDHEKREAIIEGLDGVEVVEFKGDEAETLRDILQLAVKCPLDKRMIKQLLQKMAAST